MTCLCSLEWRNPNCDLHGDAHQECVQVSCRRCSECVGQEHHWIDASDVEGPDDPDLDCKHCDAKAFTCEECDEEIAIAPNRRCRNCGGGKSS
jgi:hypothetical protein